MLKQNIKELLKLSIPILLGNVGHMLINIGDVYVAGKYNTEALAAISVASAIFMVVIIAGLGILSAITPVLSNYRGEKKSSKKYYGITVIFTQILGLVFFLITILFVPLIKISGINPLIIDDVIIYTVISAFSVFGIFLYAGLKEFLQSVEKVIFPNILMGFGVILNLSLNYLFVFGYGELRGFGTTGLAISSLIVRFMLGIILLISTAKFFKRSIYKNTKNYLKEIIKTGLPIGGALFTEFLGFNLVAVIIGRFETYYTAAHEIILMYASLSYMLPFSMAQSLSIKVGYANGAKNLKMMKNYSLASFYFILGYSIFIVMLYTYLKYPLISFFSKDTDVINAAIKVMPVICSYMVFDCLQGLFTGALKGIKKTKEVFIIMNISHLFISIPIGIFLGIILNQKLSGFWIGLAFGILSAAVLSITVFVKNILRFQKTGFSN